MRPIQRKLRDATMATVALAIVTLGVNRWLAARHDSHVRECAVRRKYARSTKDSASTELRCGPFELRDQNRIRVYLDLPQHEGLSAFWGEANKARRCTVGWKYARTAAESADVELRCGAFPDTTLKPGVNRLLDSR